MEEPRDERMDSIDPATGALTEEAVALRKSANVPLTEIVAEEPAEDHVDPPSSEQPAAE